MSDDSDMENKTDELNHAAIITELKKLEAIAKLEKNHYAKKIKVKQWKTKTN